MDPVGELVDIGTHKMHLYSLGEGQPVVILDAGSGDNVLTWFRVHAEIAKFTRVIAYDRSGLGWSERGANPRNGETVVRELHALLTAANVPGPYVLVGHSIGAVHMRMFAYAYPHLVAGLVLVDGAHENQTGRLDPEIAENWLDFTTTFEELSHKSHEQIIAHFLGSRSIDEVPDITKMMLDRLRPENMRALLEDTASTASLIKQGEVELPSLGDIPLISLTATVPAPPQGMTEEQSRQMLEAIQQCQREITQLSSRGKQIMVADAGHAIHHQQPQAVIDAVREVVEMVRRG